MQVRILLERMLILTCLLSAPMVTLAQEVPYTLADRERLVRVETKLDEMEKRFEQRFDQMDKRFDQMISLFQGIVGAFAGIVAVTIVFAIWDRRTALAPALRRSQGLEERQDRIERALREWAQENPQMAEVLRRRGLL